ncbi:hypothetical protein P9112_006943 [Eukaryota sp. TZLM1-RC]
MLTPTYSVSQTLSSIDVIVDLPSVSTKNIDVIISDFVVKVNAPPYALLLDLPHKVSLTKSFFKCSPGEAIISLEKLSRQYWPYVHIPEKELSKKGRSARRDASMERYLQHVQEIAKSNESSSAQHSRELLNKQWQLQKEERKRTEKLVKERQQELSSKLTSFSDSMDKASVQTQQISTEDVEEAPVRKSISISVQLTPSGSIGSREERPETYFKPGQQFDSQIDALIERARNLITGGDLVSALNVTSSALAKEPFSLSVLDLRSEINLKLNKKDQCLADISTALSNIKEEEFLTPNQKVVIGRLYERQSNVLMDKHQLFESWKAIFNSIKYFDESNMIESEKEKVRITYRDRSFYCADSLLSLGRKYLVADKFDEAISVFKECIEIGQKCGKNVGELGSLAWLNLLYALIKLHEFEKAAIELSLFEESKLFKYLPNEHFSVLESRKQLLDILLVRV